MDLLKNVREGNPRAIGRAISIVENGGKDALELMRRISRLGKKTLILGITGAPGSGKSTLADKLICHFREKRMKVGVVGIDPSSPFTGGAVLGDRIRMMRHSTDPDVFIRSMAARGHAGGLAKATGDAVALLAAAGKDIVLLETVGAGQGDVEVVKLADIILVVLTPRAGDDIQMFKAGIMEIADVFVLNKSDLAGTEKLEAQIKAMLELGTTSQVPPRIVHTSAVDGKGTDVLTEEILRLGAEIKKR
jgi:LAO/AO transport system kinase